MAPVPQQVLEQEEWLPQQEEYSARVRRFTEPYLQRRSAGEKHPVEDFLFTYYNHKPGQLLRWHPGAGTALRGPLAGERRNWKYYTPLPDGAVTVDLDAFLSERAETLAFVRVILAGTLRRPGQFGCFGLHEWAMAYKSELNGVRHDYLGLRLGADGTDAVVEEARIRCSHFDAFRFYTPQAVPLNELAPTRENQRHLEQPGCLHANMDVYKWAYKLSPLLPSTLILDCFELSWRIRILDMQASPYDLGSWGYPPIRIETPEGRAAYVREQRRFSSESQQLRSRLLEHLDAAEALARPATTRNGGTP
ncbi:3-methyladenine DNA glycosylase [Arthrobacter sp. MSA 4-2]|uniref:3-methyladenine DNA glycosylase n=1 Tax=Arthrobacter sp. MSA 4-2 TaxID=2794349 RepID=UPI0018E8A26C|nr:3-methyladenine DNA glycosylase [Arthrobacter sp. MSA 4-2]MBJ2120795.1 3-methyladenine DNA glycosylase [Arthrobacter sp. MSA 4-2]